jgi:hypothetical protein
MKFKPGDRVVIVTRSSSNPLNGILGTVSDRVPTDSSRTWVDFDYLPPEFGTGSTLCFTDNLIIELLDLVESPLYKALR